jgi:hypothetical protein
MRHLAGGMSSTTNYVEAAGSSKLLLQDLVVIKTSSEVFFVTCLLN